MDRLLEETRKKRDTGLNETRESRPTATGSAQDSSADIASLVASVKRKSQNEPTAKSGKRRKTAA